MDTATFLGNSGRCALITAATILDGVLDSLLKLPGFMIDIGGFNDDSQPGEGERFRGHCEVSALHAANVLGYLAKLGVEWRFQRQCRRGSS